MSFRVVHYINQFFANIGGEEMAHVAPELREGAVGPGMAFNQQWKGEAEVVKTIVCGDSYFAEHESLADVSPLATAVVTGGNANMVINLPPMDKVIGTLDYVDIIAGGHAGSLQPDGSIDAELQIITGATNEMGFNRLSAR